MTSVDSLQWDRLACDLRLARSAAADTPEAERLKILREMLAGALKGLDDQRRKACLEQLRRSFPAFGVYEMQPVASPQPAQEPQRLTLPELLHELGKVVAKTERREAVRLARSALEVMPKQEQEEVLGFLRALLPTEKAPAVPTPPPAPAPAPPPLPENGTKDWGELVGKKFALGRSAQLDDLERIVEAFRDSRRTLKEINKYAADTMHSLTRKVVSQGMVTSRTMTIGCPRMRRMTLKRFF